MKAGWELRKDSCQQVATVLQEYINIFHKYIPSKEEKDIKDFNLFVQGLKAKI